MNIFRKFNIHKLPKELKILYILDNNRKLFFVQEFLKILYNDLKKILNRNLFVIFVDTMKC